LRSGDLTEDDRAVRRRLQRAFARSTERPQAQRRLGGGDEPLQESQHQIVPRFIAIECRAMEFSEHLQVHGPWRLSQNKRAPRHAAGLFASIS
jgi:hypothetical protein